ncbi:MAG TPA: divergent PAP2 family protein [Clostridiales bacterium]|nr:divergent PAP2 family protein [Clostridiales bacterium]
MNFWAESVLVTSVIAWFTAQVIKVITSLIQDKRFDFRRLVGSGGMPSSHASFVTSLATSVGIIEGFSSTDFAICTVFALVVMYDAAGVRRAAGQQARILNKILEDFEKSDFSQSDKHLKELLGHTPKEVFVGALLGIAIALLRHML